MVMMYTCTNSTSHQPTPDRQLCYGLCGGFMLARRRLPPCPLMQENVHMRSAGCTDALSASAKKHSGNVLHAVEALAFAL